MKKLIVFLMSVSILLSGFTIFCVVVDFTREWEIINIQNVNISPNSTLTFSMDTHSSDISINYIEIQKPINIEDGDIGYGNITAFLGNSGDLYSQNVIDYINGEAEILKCIWNDTGIIREHLPGGISFPATNNQIYENNLVLVVIAANGNDLQWNNGSVTISVGISYSHIYPLSNTEHINILIGGIGTLSISIIVIGVVLKNKKRFGL